MNTTHLIKKVRNQFTDLSILTVRSRRRGTTSLLKKIAEQNDVWIIVPNKESKEEIGPSAVSLSELKAKMEDTPRPILLDNSTIEYLCEMGYTLI